MTMNWKMFATVCLGGALACLPEGEGGECSAGDPCPQRGHVCNEATHQCELAQLDVDATAEGDAPASFSGVPLPFFRGEVCVATKVKPGDKVPVRVSPCVHPCVSTGGFSFKQQYKCAGSSCESLVLVYYPAASGTDCPADAFGKFSRSQCVTADYDVSVGPYIVNNGPIQGLATVELPFLSNDDIKTLLPLENDASARVAKTWELAYQYPPSDERVFDITMNGGNPSAPADCSDKSKCECRSIGF